MRYGRLITQECRKITSCDFCTEPIDIGDFYPSLTYFYTAPKKKAFSYRLHWECIKPYCLSDGKKRLEKEKKYKLEQGIRKGRPCITLTPEQKKVRISTQYMMWKTKQEIMACYNTDNKYRLRGRWLRLASLLRTYGSGACGPVGKYILGNNIGEMVIKDIGFYNRIVKAEGDPTQMAIAIEKSYLEKDTEDDFIVGS